MNRLSSRKINIGQIKKLNLSTLQPQFLFRVVTLWPKTESASITPSSTLFFRTLKSINFPYFPRDNMPGQSSYSAHTTCAKYKRISTCNAKKQKADIFARALILHIALALFICIGNSVKKSIRLNRLLLLNLALMWLYS